MREIKFRAWDKGNAEVRTDIVVGKLGSQGYIETHEGNLFEGILLQYTGLKDKSFNEVDVYEGDLFGKSDGEGIEVFGEVYFDTDFAGFCVKYPSGGWTTLGEHLLEKQNHREVIGNIYENPELVADTKVTDMGLKGLGGNTDVSNPPKAGTSEVKG